MFEGRDQEDIGAGDQVQCFTYKSSTNLLLIIPGLIIVICREDGLQRVTLGEDGAANNDYFLD